MLIAHESPRHNLKLLWWLRNIAITGQSATIAFCVGVLGAVLPLPSLFCIVALLLVVNILTHFRLKLPAPVRASEFFAQLVIDMLGLAGLLYFTGGAANPFTSLFLLQVVLAAVVLPAALCGLSACIAVTLYTALMAYSRSLPMLAHRHGDFFSLHVLGMWVNFLLLAILVAWFAYRMAASLRRQDMLLAEAQQLAVLGTFAAQAAHDLGTPLATMALLAERYRDEAPDDAAKKRAHTLLAQIARCKGSISNIAASAGVMRAESGRPVPLDRYVSGIGEHFRQLRPEAPLKMTITGSMPAPVILTYAGLEQAVGNLLANAADASQGFLLFGVHWNAHLLTIAIADDGKGIDPSVLASLDAPQSTTKAGGLGMGLFLAKTVIARLGGTLKAQLPKTGGTVMQVTLPLSRLLS